MSHPKRATFDVAVNAKPNRAQVNGYTLGDFGAHKVKYHWQFTHLPTGVALSAPWIETLGPAMAHLAQLALHGPDEMQQKILDRNAGRWGLGLVGG